VLRGGAEVDLWEELPLLKLRGGGTKSREMSGWGEGLPKVVAAELLESESSGS